jgi:hypothetical protein
VRVDHLQVHSGQTLIIPQAAELQQRGGIRRRHAGQVSTDEAAKGLTILQCILDALVRPPKALLRHNHAQHARGAM